MRVVLASSHPPTTPAATREANGGATMAMRVLVILGASILVAPSLSACQGTATIPAPTSSPTAAPAAAGSLVAAPVLLGESTPSPAPASSSTPSPVPAEEEGGGGTEGADSDPVSGVPEIGPHGDPCALLSASDIEDGLGVKVLAIARGKLDADEGQTCAYAVDAPGVTSGLPPNLGLDPSEGTLGPFMKAFEAAGKNGVFGVHVGVARQ